MAEKTEHTPGTFCWFDAGVPDVGVAKRFYTEVLGWSYADRPMGPGEMYSMAQVRGRDVAAIFPQRPEMKAAGAPPFWQSYISVTNVDETAAKVEKLGGKLMMPTMDVFDAGRMALIQDPTGAMVALWQPKKNIGAGLVGDPGSFCWAELMTTDTDRAAAFYTSLLGWTCKDSGMPGMQYNLFYVGGDGIAGMMKITPEMGPIPPNWLVYFAVEGVDAAVERAQRLGGKALMPAMDIPEVGRIVTLQDPGGAVFALIHPVPMPAG